jgi:hypothetical protein
LLVAAPPRFLSGVIFTSYGAIGSWVLLFRFLDLSTRVTISGGRFGFLSLLAPRRSFRCLIWRCPVFSSEFDSLGFVPGLSVLLPWFSVRFSENQGNAKKERLPAADTVFPDYKHFLLFQCLDLSSELAFQHGSDSRRFSCFLVVSDA